MKIASADLAAIITAVGTLLTIVGNFLVNLLMMRKQTRQINEHSTQTTEEVKSAISSATGTFKALDPR